MWSVRSLLFAWAVLFASLSAFGQDTLSAPPLSARLNELADRLEKALNDSQADWDTLSFHLTSLSTTLQELSASSRDSEREIESTRRSLANLETLLARQKLLLDLAPWGIGIGVLAGLFVGLAVAR